MPRYAASKKRVSEELMSETSPAAPLNIRLINGSGKHPKKKPAGFLLYRKPAGGKAGMHRLEI